MAPSRIHLSLLADGGQTRRNGQSSRQSLAERRRASRRCGARLELLETRALLSEIRGLKFQDFNANGIRDSIDAPLAGVAVYLDRNGNGAPDAGEPSTVTDADGKYAFTGLAAGTYTVAEVVPTGYVQTAPRGGRLFAALPDGSNALAELDPATLGVIRQFAAPEPFDPGSAPVGLAFDGDHLYFINGFGTKTLYELDPDTGAVLDADPITAGSGLYDGLATLNGLVYISDFAAVDIHVFDPATDAVVKSLDVDALNPGVSIGGGIAGITGPDAIVAGVVGTGQVAFLDPTTGRVLGTFGTTSFGGFVTGAAVVDGRIYLSGAGNDSAAIYTRDGKQVAALGAPFGPRYSGLGGDDVGDAPAGVHVVTLAEGEVLSNLNFGNNDPTVAVITGTAFLDIDADGIFEFPERGVSGATIYADLNTNGVLDPGEPSTVANSGGFYALAVPAGPVTIAQVVPANFEATAPRGQRLFSADSFTGTIVEISPSTGGPIRRLPAPEAFAGQPVGLAFDGKSLYVLSGSGSQALYQLDPDTGAVIDSDVLTVGSGTYDDLASLGGLVYILDAGNGDILAFDPASDAVVATLDIDALNPGVSIAGGLAGITGPDALLATDANGGRVYLIDPASGLVTGSFATVPGPAIGNETAIGVVDGRIYVGGNFLFWVYTRDGEFLNQVQPAFYVPAGLGGDDVDASPFGTFTADVKAGEVLSSVDFGSTSLIDVEIRAIGYRDLNNNGARDEGEPALTPLFAFIDYNGNGQPELNEQFPQPDEDGVYAIRGLDPGTYTVIVSDPPFGYAFTTPSTRVITVGPDEVATVEFGFRLVLAEVRGTIFEDLDGDGTRDEGEPPLPLGLVVADLNGNGAIDFGEEPFGFVDAQGNYSLLVAAGSFPVLYQPNSGYVSTTPNPVLVTAAEGESIAADFGVRFVQGLVTGVLFNDLDRDGVRGADEPPIGNFLVFADLNGDGQFQFDEPFATTNLDGSYALPVLPGTYSILVRTELGFEPVAPVAVTVGVLETVPGVDFALARDAEPVALVDDGTFSFRLSGGGWRRQGEGYEGDARIHTDGANETPSNVARWFFQRSPGLYEVFVTWTPRPENASNATYNVFSGANVVGFVQVDQRRRPDDLLIDGVYWESLGSYFTPSGSLTLALFSLADGDVVADAAFLDELVQPTSFGTLVAPGGGGGVDAAGGGGGSDGALAAPPEGAPPIVAPQPEASGPRVTTAYIDEAMEGLAPEAVDGSDASTSAGPGMAAPPIAAPRVGSVPVATTGDANADAVKVGKGHGRGGQARANVPPARANRRKAPSPRPAALAGGTGAQPRPKHDLTKAPSRRKSPMNRFHRAIKPGLMALILLAGGAAARADFTDPTGDTFGAGPVQHDLTVVTARLTGAGTAFTIQFADAIADASAFAPESVTGLIEIDIDRDATTGAASQINDLSPPSAGPPIALGVEYYVDLFSEAFQPGLVDIFDAQTNLLFATASITYTSTSLSFVVPLTGTNPGGLLNYAVLVGTFSEATDRGPNGPLPATSVPEPATLTLLGVGGAFLCTLRRIPRRPKTNPGA